MDEIIAMLNDYLFISNKTNCFLINTFSNMSNYKLELDKRAACEQKCNAESMKSTFYSTFHNSAMRTFVQDTSQSKVHKYCTTES